MELGCEQDSRVTGEEAVLRLNQMQSVNVRRLLGSGNVVCSLRVKKTEPGKLEFRLTEPGRPSIKAEFSEMKVRQLLRGAEIIEVRGFKLDSRSSQSGQVVYIRLQEEDVYTVKRDVLTDTIFQGEI